MLTREKGRKWTNAKNRCRRRKRPSPPKTETGEQGKRSDGHVLGARSSAGSVTVRQCSASVRAAVARAKRHGIICGDGCRDGVRLGALHRARPYRRRGGGPHPQAPHHGYARRRHGGSVRGVPAPERDGGRRRPRGGRPRRALRRAKHLSADGTGERARPRRTDGDSTGYGSRQSSEHAFEPGGAGARRSSVRHVRYRTRHRSIGYPFRSVGRSGNSCGARAVCASAARCRNPSHSGRRPRRRPALPARGTARHLPHDPARNDIQPRAELVCRHWRAGRHYTGAGAFRPAPRACRRSARARRACGRNRCGSVRGQARTLIIARCARGGITRLASCRCGVRPSLAAHGLVFSCRSGALPHYGVLYTFLRASGRLRAGRNAQKPNREGDGACHGARKLRNTRWRACLRLASRCVPKRYFRRSCGCGCYLPHPVTRRTQRHSEGTFR